MWGKKMITAKDAGAMTREVLLGKEQQKKVKESIQSIQDTIRTKISAGNTSTTVSLLYATDMIIDAVCEAFIDAGYAVEKSQHFSHQFTIDWSAYVWSDHETEQRSGNSRDSKPGYPH